ncbi:MAG: beta-ketoacyl-[acyl-carrier-protein] synthase family protein [Phycisphaerales bacterium]|nr:beta-ketoacyl-[acyl-carrier-protein] synthase family protein [Phycisphaerales bacterium]
MNTHGQRTDSERVVVTGMGWVTPLGHDIETVWGALMRGECGMAPITHFDARTFPTSFAAEVKGFDVAPQLKDPRAHSTAGLNSQFALGAAAQAWAQAGLSERPARNMRRVGIYLGAGEGVIDTPNYLATNLGAWDPAIGKTNGVEWAKLGHSLMGAASEIEQEPNMPLAHIAREFGVRGPSYNCLTACAASTQAIGEACSILRGAEADVMIAGGAHTMIHVLGITGFNRLTALSTAGDDPTTASRPFDLTRGGFVMGEGAGMVILETLSHARSRGATPLAELIGFGSSADSYRITDIQPEGRGAAAAMLQALAQAGIDPRGRRPDGRPWVDYISAHGTGTKENDSIETLAVKRVFGELARDIPMSSVKSMLGHLIAAAGAVEFITCVLAIERGMLPPTINYTTPDPECDLDCVPNTPRKAQVDTCLSNSFGFGGQNDTVCVTRFVE